MATIKASTDVLTNYLLGSTAAPDEKFSAVQTLDGHTILFTIGTDHVLYLTEEILGNNTGWIRNDISTGLKDDFKNLFPNATSIYVKSFAAAQADNQPDGSSTFCLLVAVSYNGNDYLFKATNYTRDADNYISITWQYLPYDGSKTFANINISSINLMETLNGSLIVVDLASNGDLMRFYVDAAGTISKTYQSTTNPTQKWLYYNLPTDILPLSSTNTVPVVTVAGRRNPDSINGLYTLGKGSMGKNRIVYQALFYTADPTTPAGIIELLLPDDTLNPQQIAVAPTVIQSPTTCKFTDLYVTTADGSLYVFKANKQMDLSPSNALFIKQSPLFVDMQQLFAYRTSQKIDGQIVEKVIVWGRNRGGQVWYMQCGIDNNDFYGPWTTPMSIEEGVTQISPYVNRKNGGNTYFANIGTVGNDKFKKVFQDPISTLWQSQDINLPVNDTADPKAIDTYTTKIIFTDASQTAIANAPALLSSTYRLPVLINNKYFVLDDTPIRVEADANGSLSVIQTVNDDLSGSCLKVQSLLEDPMHPGIYNADSPLITINPMDKSNAQLLALNTPDSLSAAEIKADDGTVTGNLVSSDATPTDLNNAASAMTQLAAPNTYLTTSTPTASAKMSKKTHLAFIAHQAYIVHSKGKRTYKIHPRFKAATTPSVVLTYGTPPSGAAQPSYKEDDGEYVAAGDLFRRIRNGVKNLLITVSNVAENAWEFACTIEGELFKFVVDTIEKVAGAMQSILQAVGAIVKGLIQFVKFLFSWSDIHITAQVCTKMVKIMMNHLVYGLEGVDTDAETTSLFKDLSAILNNWTDSTLDCPSFDDTSSNASTASQTSQSTTTSTSTSTTTTTTSSDDAMPDTYLQDQLTNNAQNSAFADTSPVVADDEQLDSLFDILKQAIEKEEDIIKKAFNDFYDNILKDFAFRKMSILEALQKTLGYMADFMLLSLENIVVSLIDVLKLLLTNVWDYLNKSFRIPILSPILKKFFNYELPSAIDLIMLVTAMPATMGYMVLYKKGPFSTNGVQDQMATDILALDEYAKTKSAADKAFTDLMGIIDPSVSKSKQAAYKSDDSTDSDNDISNKDIFFFITRLITGANDVLAGSLTFITSVPGGEKFYPLRVIYMGNTAVQIVYDFATRWLTPAPALSDKLQPVAYITSTVTFLKSMSKIGFLKNKLSRVGLEMLDEDTMNDADKNRLLKSQYTDKMGDFVDSGLSSVLLLMPAISILDLLTNDERTDTGELVGLCDSGVQFCAIATSWLNTIGDVIPSETAKVLLGGVSCTTSVISSALRISEGALELAKPR